MFDLMLPHLNQPGLASYLLTYTSTSKIKHDRFLRRLAATYREDKIEARSELVRLLKEFYDKNKRRSKRIVIYNR